MMFSDSGFPLARYVSKVGFSVAEISQMCDFSTLSRFKDLGFCFDLNIYTAIWKLTD